MIKVRIMSRELRSELEEHLNLFLLKNLICKEILIDIKFSECSQDWSAMVIYDEK